MPWQTFLKPTSNFRAKRDGGGIWAARTAGGIAASSVIKTPMETDFRRLHQACDQKFPGKPCTPETGE